MNIREHVEVVARPLVVRLDHLRGENSGWISDSYYQTTETARHFDALRALFERDSGCGVFLIGHYGSGKSHFLAYLSRQLRAGAFLGKKRDPDAAPISLLNYKAAQPLETIVDEELGITSRPNDRRMVWKAIAERYPNGLVLVLDELSEFLRAKPSPQSFNEDLRFLQFLGEWAQNAPLWIVAALQEQIEHTGEIEYDLFRKIRDRYPLRLLLTPAHIHDLIARCILQKKPSYAGAVEKLAEDLRRVYPGNPARDAALSEVYPLHPVTLELLEEVRDRFSQARGIVDFTLTQLLGDPARGVTPFLDRPWGDLLAPDRIVDHFADLFEIQPEFLAIAQKVLPYFRKTMPELFPNRTQQELAWRLLKLLILVHLSPRRESLPADEAAEWLLLRVSSIDPDKNREIVRKIFDTLTTQGAYVKRQETGFSLDVEDDSKEQFDRLLGKTIPEIAARGDLLFESLIPALDRAEFNPFALPRDRWHARKIRWHFHDRELQVFFGGGSPAAEQSPALQIGLPWGPAAAGPCARIQPAAIEPNPDLLELAALYHLKDRPLPAAVLKRIEERLASRIPWFSSVVRAAYMEAEVIDSHGMKSAAPLQSMQTNHGVWLNGYAEWLLRQTYPQFERFAPGTGPLPKEAYRQFMEFVSEHDLGARDAPDYVKLIREGYLVPMGLMQRRGSEYMVGTRLDGHELVRLIEPVLKNRPSPAQIYDHLSAPVYGLVHDQIHLLLLVLLIQGELDIVKGERSYREIYQTLTNPLQYDRIVPGHALNVQQLHDLQTLCEAFRIPIPKHWSVITQRRAVEQLRKYARLQRDLLGTFAGQLRESGEAGELAAQAETLISKWAALDRGDHELQGFQHFEQVIGSVHAFIGEVNDLVSMPERFEKLLRETQRFRHLLSDPVMARSGNPDIAVRLEALGPPPPLAQPDALEAWLAQAGALYRIHQEDYGRRHDRWWAGAVQHPIWSAPIPSIARSRHLMAEGLIREIEQTVVEARPQRCPGLTPLDFQATCRCGFDGSASPLASTFERFEAGSRRLEAELTLFFQQDRVKARVREWVNEGIEVNTGTLSYLEGKRPYPEVENLRLFDQHLSGLELVKPVSSAALMDFLGDRVWEKTQLLAALEQFFERNGPRISFRRPETPPPKRDLLVWCYEQALRQGFPLPPVFSRTEQDEAAELIDPRWIGAASLGKLEELGLGEPGVRRVLNLILDGLVHAPQSMAAKDGPVAAALELLKFQPPGSVDELAARIERLYAQHERFRRLRLAPWLELLERLAHAAPPDLPEKLEVKLREHTSAQWIVVDCLGILLAETARGALARGLPDWDLSSIEFARVGEQTSTDAFYRTLIGGDFAKSFDKIDAIDQLVHERALSLADLQRIAAAELEIAFRRLAPRLDPVKPVLIFGDHGFRLAPDGRGFTHGGPSTLERLTLTLLATTGRRGRPT